MGLIHNRKADKNMETISLDIDERELDFFKATDLARQKARDTNSDAMLLAWHNGATGEFYPRFDCGSNERPAWRVFAESRGANLKIDINKGTYTFMFLRL